MVPHTLNRQLLFLNKNEDISTIKSHFYMTAIATYNMNSYNYNCNGKQPDLQKSNC